MLSGEHLEALLSGRKRATIRLGRLRPSRVVYIHSGGRIAARAWVAHVEYKKFGELGREEALLEGMKSPEELKLELKRIYPHIDDESEVTVIAFARVEPIDEPEAKWPNPVRVAEAALERLSLSREDRKVLEAIVRAGSIRGAAAMLYGDAERRGRIRAVLRRAAKALGRELLDATYRA